MKKTIFFSTSLLLAFILLNPVSAQQGREQGVTPGEPVKTEKTIQVQQNTQNQGEEQNLQVENTLQGEEQNLQIENTLQGEAGEAGEAVQDNDSIQGQNQINRDDALLKIKSKGVTMSEGSQLVKQKSNDVAQKVQELLLNREYKGGIGEQVKVIAQNQLKAQEEFQNRLANLEERPLWQRFFLGQKEEDVEGLQNSLRNNQEALTELESLLEDKTLSAEDRLAIEEAYLELRAQQELVETHLTNILGEFSVAGFFRKLFRRS